MRSKDICINRLRLDSCVKECVHAQKWTSSDQETGLKRLDYERQNKLNIANRQPPIPITKQDNKKHVSMPPKE